MKSETVPLPRERPPAPEDQTSASRIESEFCPVRGGSPKLPNSNLNRRSPVPANAQTDVVNVNAVLLPDNHRVVFSPVVTLQCSMAEVVAHWILMYVAPTLDALGMSLRGVETLELFGCRAVHGISGAKLSEHGHANALDVELLEMATGTVIALTNATVSKSLREQLRQTACARFSTVLGNGADAYHENHVHIDLMQRTNNYKICQWNILDRTQNRRVRGKELGGGTHPFPRRPPSPMGFRCHCHARQLTLRHWIQHGKAYFKVLRTVRCDRLTLLLGRIPKSRL